MMATQHEPGTRMPTVISAEAWEMAMIIDVEIHKMFLESGLRRVEGRSKMTEVIARMVQLAINKTLDKVLPADAGKEK